MALIDQINNYWQILTFIAVVIFYAIWTYFRVNSHENRILDLENRATTIEDTSDTFRESIKVDIGKIMTTLDFIKETIVELKQKK